MKKFDYTEFKKLIEIAKWGNYSEFLKPEGPVIAHIEDPNILIPNELACLDYLLNHPPTISIEFYGGPSRVSNYTPNTWTYDFYHYVASIDGLLRRSEEDTHNCNIAIKMLWHFAKSGRNFSNFPHSWLIEDSSLVSSVTSEGLEHDGKMYRRDDLSPIEDIKRIEQALHKYGIRFSYHNSTSIRKLDDVKPI